MCKIGAKLRFIPKGGVLCLKENTLDTLNIAQMIGLDRLHIVGNPHDPARADQFVQIELVDASCALDEMIGCIHVRSRMCPKCEFRHV